MLTEQLEALRQKLGGTMALPEDKRAWWIETCRQDIEQMLKTVQVVADHLRR